MVEKYTEHATFICGHRKSGTTLLLCLLDNHPELLTFPVDSAFFYGYYPAFDTADYTDQQKTERMAVFVANKLEIELFNLSEKDRKDLHFPLNEMRGDIRAFAAKSDKKPRDMLISLMRAYRKHFTGSEKAVRWVEKTTSSEIYAARIREWFPKAKFIHVIRDPRDNWASLKSGWNKLYYRFNDSPARLMQQMIERCGLGMEFARRNANRFGPEVYKIIKFEDLTANPEKELREICDFLQISFSESMRIPTVCGKLWKGNNFSGRRFVKPSAVNAGRWRERISGKEACLIEFHFGSLMKYFDYECFYPSDECADAATDHYCSLHAGDLLAQLCPDLSAAAENTGEIKEDIRSADKICTFRVSPADGREESPRCIVIGDQAKLEELGEAVREAFALDKDHICCFTYEDSSGLSVNVHHPEMNIGPPWTDEVRIREIPLHPGDSMKFLYDFADNREFDIVLEKTESRIQAQEF